MEKDVIKIIAEKLKKAPDTPYREGAWERFQQANANAVKNEKIQQIKKWSAAAAALLIFGASITYYNSIQDKVGDHTFAAEDIISSQPYNIHSYKEDKISEDILVDLNNHVKSISTLALDSPQTKATIEVNTIQDIAPVSINLDSYDLDYGKIDLAQVEPIRPATATTISPIHTASIQTANLILANKAIVRRNITHADQDIVKNRSFSLGKFDLGLFVSPNATSEKANFGGGMLLSYNLSKKISLRTGASFNTYTVGKLKNPESAESVEMVLVAPSVYNDISNTTLQTEMKTVQATHVIIPNINAVTGLVQAVDIPLEIKYNVSNNLYATAGASYSAIVNQERNAQYIENVYEDTGAKGNSPVLNQTKAVTKQIKSIENNVNPNRFNGFVNFSVGQKVKVNNKLGLSIEPYVKLPIGQYTKSEMNYTNGGIKLITTF